MERPKCFNRPAFAQTLEVQDGYVEIGRPGGTGARVPHMVTIVNPMSMECQQHEEFGEARRNGWNCDGCRWKP